ncbi:MAG: hypothetical protein KY455_05350 [Euryarchaeota archaeon]|nr:hypothetical protein [Euryarchaeota archaeon]
MVEPSESARRIESTFSRFGVSMDGKLEQADILIQKKALGMAIPPFVEKVRAELDQADLPASTGRMLKLRLKHLEDAASGLAALPPADRFEDDELAIFASLIDIVVTLLGLSLEKEYRAQLP